jgi:rod shape determining protein RodA
MKQTIDFLLLAPILALGAISLLSLFAVNTGLAQSQLVFWVAGLGAFYFASRFYYPHWKNIALPFFVASIVSLFVVFIVGESVRGSTRWIDLGVFRFQPSEVAKVSSILLLAGFFHKRSAEKLANVVLSLVLVLPAFILIFLEPDIGSAMAIMAIWLAVAFAAGMKKEHIFALSLGFVLTAVISYELLAPYQKERIATFLRQDKDPLGSGYNIIQSKIAVGSGGILGRGLGRGSQSQLNFLPENESDFMFASIAEQLGFLGASLTILLSAAMILRIVTHTNETDRFGQLILMGTTGLLLYQFSVNIGMNIGVIPVTGITLPLVSYGGSSLISTLFLIGILQSISRYEY